MSTVSIADQLKVLIELQKLDGEIYRLKRTLRAKPETENRLKQELKVITQGAQAADARYKALEVKRNQKETDLAQKEQQIKKLQGQLFQLKTNKEYSAMQKEIEGLKADQSVLEEEILRGMEEIEQAKAQVVSDRQNVKAEEEKLAGKLKTLEEEAGGTQAEIQQMQAKRSELTPKVEPVILAQYERILERREGLALVPVRGGACAGCYMGLTPQTVNEVQLTTRLIPCESCARILYMEPAV